MGQQLTRGVLHFVTCKWCAHVFTNQRREECFDVKMTGWQSSRELSGNAHFFLLASLLECV